MRFRVSSCLVTLICLSSAAVHAADVDLVVRPPKPLTVKIGAGAAGVEKKVTIDVLNAASDPAGATIRLSVGDGDCPAGTVSGLPDFGKKNAGTSDTIALLPGKKGKATVRIAVSAAAFTSVAPKVPVRCALAIGAATTVPSGAVDPSPWNASTPLGLDVLDANDPAGPALAEVALAPAKPIAIAVAPGKVVTKTVKIAALNASSGNGLGTPHADVVVVTVGGDCPADLTTGVDFDKAPGVQTSVRVKAGKKASGKLALTIDASKFPPGTKTSPARCVLTVAATAPANSDGSNDVARIVIDVAGGSGSAPAANHLPTASFTVGIPGGPLAPVTFDGSASSDPDGEPLDYAWSFGDGGVGGVAALAHGFAQAGTFTVRLTVTDPRGGSAFIEHDVTITAGPTAQGVVPAAGVVRALDGSALPGVSVVAEGGGTGTTDAQGKITINVPRGVPFKLVFTKTGLTTQYVPFSVPVGAESAVFETIMLPQEAAQTLNATVGGTAAGKDGATLILPPGALVGDGGAPVSGLVSITITPVDPTSAPQSFPGRYAGFNAAGEEGLLLSHGTVEYVLFKNGVPVHLAPGATATIEIPLYATLDKSGTPITVGTVIPLWSLDERTGGWIQEGTGVVVAAPGSPSGLALRASVGHLSWWNCDAFERPAYLPKPKCMVDSNADGILEDLTGTGHCWNAGTGPEQPPDILNPIRLLGTNPRAVLPNNPRAVLPRYPAYTAQAEIPAAGGVVLPVPADLDITLRASAKGGTLVGTKILHGAAGVEEEVVIKLEPLDADDAVPITLPWDQTYTLPAGTADQYRFSATAGDEIYVIVSRSNPATGLTGTVTALGPDAYELGPATFGNASGKLGFIAPTTGQYRLIVSGTAGQPAGYRLEVSHDGTVPILVSTTPARDATDVAVGTTVTANFTAALNASTVTAAGLNPTFTLTGPLGIVAGSASASDTTATFTPTLPLDPAVAYTAHLTTGIKSTSGDALSAAYEWSFTTAGDASTVPLAAGIEHTLAVGPDGEAFAIYQQNQSGGLNRTSVSRFVTGEGWKAPVPLPVPQGETSSPAIAASADGSVVAVWKARINGGPSVAGIFASHYTPDDGWSAPETLEPANNNVLSTIPQVAVDDTGRAIAIWRYGNELRWRRYEPASGWTATATLFPAGAQPTRESSFLTTNGAGKAAVIRFSGNDVLVRRFDPTTGWADAETIANNNFLSGSRIGIDPNGNLHAIYKKQPAWVTRRYDVATATWEPEQTLLADGAAAYDVDLVVSPSGNAIFASVQSIPGRVWTSRFDGTAKTWSSAATLINEFTCTFDLALAADESVGWLGWIACQNNPNTLRWSRYTTAGGWAAPVDVVEPSLWTGIHPPSVRVGILPDDTALLIYRRSHLADSAILAAHLDGD